MGGILGFLWLTVVESYKNTNPAHPPCNSNRETAMKSGNGRSKFCGNESTKTRCFLRFEILPHPQSAAGAEGRGEIHDCLVRNAGDVRNGLRRDLRRVQSDFGQQAIPDDDILRKREFWHCENPSKLRVKFRLKDRPAVHVGTSNEIQIRAKTSPANTGTWRAQFQFVLPEGKQI